MPRATKNSSKTAAGVGRSAITGINTTGKKSLPTIRNRGRTTHGSAGRGTDAAPPSLFPCSKCENYAAKSKAGLSSHMRAKHPPTPAPPTRSPGNEAESLPPGTPPPALTTGNHNSPLRTPDRSTSDGPGASDGDGDVTGLTGLLGRVGSLPFVGRLRTAMSAFQQRGQKRVTFSNVIAGYASAPALVRNDGNATAIFDVFQACDAENITGKKASELAVRILESLSMRPTHALVVGVSTKLLETNFDKMILHCPQQAANDLLHFIRDDYHPPPVRRLFADDDESGGNVGAKNATLATAFAPNTQVATPSKTNSLPPSVGIQASVLKPFATPQPPARAPPKQGLHTVDRSNPSQDQNLVARLSKVEGIQKKHGEKIVKLENFNNETSQGMEYLRRAYEMGEERVDILNDRVELQNMNTRLANSKKKTLF